MSYKTFTFTCFFENDCGEELAKTWVDLLAEGEGHRIDAILLEKGHPSLFHETEETSIEYCDSSIRFLEFRSEIYFTGTEKGFKGFISLLAEAGATFIILDIFDDQVGEGKTYYYQSGERTSKKNIKSQLASLPAGLRFVLATSIVPEKLPQYLAELGGYSARIYGKPVLFHIAAQPHLFDDLIEDLFEKADLHAIDNASGDSVIHHICRREVIDSDILIRLIKKGVNATATNHRGERPIQLDIKRLGYWSHADRSKILIERGGESPDALFSDGMPFLYKYLKEFGINDFFMKMISLGGNINYPSPEGTAAWIARECDPEHLGKLAHLNAEVTPGKNTYIHEPLVDIATAIAFLDDENFDKSLLQLKSLYDTQKIKEIFLQCIKYGYLRGFLMLEQCFSTRISVTELGIVDYGAKVNAYNYCRKYFNKKRNRQNYLSIIRKLIENSSIQELESTMNDFNWRWITDDEEEFIGQLELLKSKGVDLTKLKLRDFSRMETGPHGKEKIDSRFNDCLRKLLALNVDLSSIMFSYEKESYFSVENRDVLESLMRKGQTRILQEYIRENYSTNRDQLLQFLLTTDLSNFSVQAIIWDTLLSTIWPGNHKSAVFCEFSEEFLIPLIKAGLPLNNAYKSRQGVYWTPYSASKYSTAPPGYKVFLEAQGLNEELSNAAQQVARATPGEYLII